MRVCAWRHGDDLLLYGPEVVDGLLRSAGEEVDMVIAARRAAQDHAVRVEGGGGDGTAAVLLQEAGIGLHPGKLRAVEVENLDSVRGRPPVIFVSEIG